MRCRWCRCEGQAWGMRGAVPPATWALATSDMLFLLFLPFSPGRVATFAFSQCVSPAGALMNMTGRYNGLQRLPY